MTTPEPACQYAWRTWLTASLRKRWLATVLGAAICLIGAMIANSLWRVGYISNDAAYFAYAHELMGEGRLPYRDFFALHGPVTFWLGGLFVSIFGAKIGTWLLGSLVTLALMASAAWLAVGAVGRDFDTSPDDPDPTRWIRYAVAAAVAAALAAGWGRVIGFVPVGGRPKFLAVALLLIAVGLLSRRRYVFSGTLLALACWTWQIAVFQTAGVLLAWLSLTIMRGRRRDALRRLVLIVAPMAAVSVVCVILLVIEGVWSDFVEHAIVFPAQYAVDPWEARGVPRPTGLSRLLMPLEMGIELESFPRILLVAAVLGFVATLVVLYRERDQHQKRSMMTIDARWGIFALFAASYIQVLFISHGPGYAVPLLAPTGAMAGWVIGSFVTVRSWTKWAILAIAAAGAVTLIIRTARPVGFPTMEEQRRAAAPVIESAGDGEALVIGDPILRVLVGGEPHEFDMQWVYGRQEYLRREYPGGEAGFAAHLLNLKPRIIYISSRASGFEPTLLTRMKGAYEPIPGVLWDDRPVYRRVEQD